MGKSQSIRDLEARDPQFANDLAGARNELNTRADAMDQALGNQITAWKAQAADARIIVTGRNLDFVHEASFSFDRLVDTLNAAVGAVFTGTEAPPGTTVDEAAQKEVKAALGSTAEKAAAIKLLVAGKAFDLLGNTIYDFGDSANGTFSSCITSQHLDLGMRMFVGIGQQTSNSESFFSNETIYEYVFTYQVLYSLEQLQQQVTEQTIEQRLANQITAFEHKKRRIPVPDDPMSEQGAKYDALMAWYTRHINDAMAQLRRMEP